MRLPRLAWKDRLPRLRPVPIAEHVTCIIVLALLPLMPLWGLISSGDLPFDADAIFYELPWESARPEHLPPVDPGGPRVIPAHTYPDWLFLHQSVQNGESLQWNPQSGYGAPFLAQWRTRALSPFSWPFEILPLASALTFSIYLKLFAAGLSAFFGARLLRYSAAAAFTVAAAYQFSPLLLLWWNYPVTDSFAWFPLLLVVLERFGDGRTRTWPAATAVMALMLVGGEPECVIAALAFGAVFVFARTVVVGRKIRTALTPVAVLLFSGVAAAAVAGVQVAPYIEWVNQAEPLKPPRTPYTFNWSDVVLGLFPDWNGPAHVSSAGGPAAILTMYAGMLFLTAPQWMSFPFWLSIRSEVKQPRRRFVDALLVATLLFTALGACWAALNLTAPGFLSIGVEHFWFIIALTAGLVLGRCADEWAGLSDNQCTDSLRRFALRFLIMAAPMIGIVMLARTIDPVDRPSIWPQVMTVAILAVGFLGIVVGTMLKPNLRAFAYGMATLIVIGNLWAHGGAQSHRPASQLFPTTPLIDAFRSGESRIGGIHAAPWPLSVHGIANTVVEPGAALERQRAFEQLAERDPALLARAGHAWLLLTDSEMQDSFSAIRNQIRVEEAFESGDFLVELLNAQPRVRMIYQAVTAPNLDRAPITSQGPPVIESGPAPNSEATIESAAPRIVAQSNNRMRLEVDSSAAGLLVIAEAWYPGWKALVDGDPTEVFPVDGLFRGVPVGAGQHDVELYFDSGSVRLGTRITIVATVLVSAALLGRLATIIRRRRRGH